MKFYVLEIAEGDPKVAGKAVYEYETRKEAIATFHQKLATAMKSDLFTSDQVLVVNSSNGIEASEKYISEVKEEVND